MNEFIFPQYIKREDAQKVICGWCGICENPTLEDLEKCDDICPQFSQIPNGDVRPVIRGTWRHKWICSSMSGYEYACSCSVCNKPTYRISLMEKMPNYCPNCGADMRGGEGNG